MMVELAWCRLRYQPQSHLAQWYRHRFPEKAGRSRKVGVIALARKLTITLWRFLEQGLMPQDAKIKSSDQRFSCRRATERCDRVKRWRTRRALIRQELTLRCGAENTVPDFSELFLIHGAG